MYRYKIGFNDGRIMLVEAARYSQHENIITFTDKLGQIVITVSLYNLKYIELM